MGSQTDLDQGGTFRTLQETYLGPSLGWINAFVNSVLAVTSAGPIAVGRGTTLITVNFNGPVTINLQPTKAGAAAALPGQSAVNPLTIVDIGGFAQTQTITINAAAGETIDSLASITITSAFGAYVLLPNIVSGGWTLTQ